LRVEPPAPNVTEAYSGWCAFSIWAARSNCARCSSVLGGKNSKLIEGIARASGRRCRRVYIFMSRWSDRCKSRESGIGNGESLQAKSPAWPTDSRDEASSARKKTERISALRRVLRTGRRFPIPYSRPQSIAIVLRLVWPLDRHAQVLRLLRLSIRSNPLNLFVTSTV